MNSESRNLSSYYMLDNVNRSDKMPSQLSDRLEGPVFSQNIGKGHRRSGSLNMLKVICGKKNRTEQNRT